MTGDDHRTTSSKRRRAGLPGSARLPGLVLLLLLLALLLRLHRLDAQSLWLDEGSTWNFVQQPWPTLLLDLLNPTAGYPLYHLLLKGWTMLAGDSEWALRFPSALAGALAVVALYGTAREFQAADTHPATDDPHTRQARLFPLLAAILLACSPFAIWYAQEAKVYSLLLLASVLLLWALLRGLRLRTPRAWLVFAAVALVSIFIHRLAALLLIAAWVAWLTTSTSQPAAHNQRRLLNTRRWAAVAVLSIGLMAAMVYGLGSDIAATGAAIPANPPMALWLTFLRFSVDRWPGEFPWWWLLPWVVLTLWGIALLLRDSLAGASSAGRRHAARVLLGMLLIPAGLFLVQLAFTHLYEARYLMLIYPAWLLCLAYPLAAHDQRAAQRERWHLLAVHGALVVLALAVSAAALAQPQKGIFSGYAVKEQYRQAFEVLARRLHPDDAVLLHPAYLRPLYDYYMGRLTTDPPPEPITFAAFKHRQREFNRKDWDEARRQALAGYVRSFLVIAPNHAYTVDRPQYETDEYGLVGLYFQYSRDQKKWPCGIWRFNGAHVLCQDSPEAYETGEVPQPATTEQARFGETILLSGYTLKATTPAGAGTYRAGGVVPITLFWDVTRPPDSDYSIFLHLCQNCDVPPLASEDAPPMEGYLPTSTWLPGKPVHDERAIPLPRSLPPGRYTLLLGIYRPGDPSESARLPVQGAHVISHNRLVLGTVQVTAPE